MRILRNLGSLAMISLGVAAIGSSPGCIFQADTPDKVDIKTPDVEVTPAKPDADVDIHIDKNG